MVLIIGIRASQIVDALKMNTCGGVDRKTLTILKQSIEYLSGLVILPLTVGLLPIRLRMIGINEAQLGSTNFEQFPPKSASECVRV